MAIFALCLAVMGWLTVASALFFVYREQKGYDEIAFGDVLLIFLKRDEIRHSHGLYNIEKAQEALDAGDFKAAYSLLLSGVRRAPDNLEGRMLLIRFFEAQGNHAGSRQLLETGVEYAGEDLAFYRLYGQFLSQQRDDEALIDLAREVHQRIEPQSELAQVLALFAMQAAGRLGRFEEAREFFVEHRLSTNLEGVITAARLLEKRGQVEDAIDYLTEFTRTFPKENIGAAFREIAELNLRADRPDDAISAALSYSLTQPLEAAPRILLIRAYEAAGKSEYADKEAQTVLRQFRSDSNALTRLGLYAREAGDVDLARRLYELALEGDIEVPRFGLIFLEAHLADGQYQRTIDLCNQLEQEAPEWLRVYRAEFAVMQALGYLGMGNQQLGHLYLSEFLSAPRVQTSVLFAVARTFEDMELPEYALQVLEEAHAREEQDEGILAELVDLQVRLGASRDLTARVERLLKLRRPDYDTLQRVKEELNSDRFVFADNRTELAQELRTVLAEVEGSNLVFPTARQMLSEDSVSLSSAKG